MKARFDALPRENVHLLDGEFKRRFDVNRHYLMSLATDALVFNHRIEAVLANSFRNDVLHGGWESPGCQVRGQFLGHWLSAAARIWASTRDAQIKAKADAIVAALAACQAQNGDGWVFSIPAKHLDKVVKKQQVWAPQYVLHKTLMGLYEMYAIAGNEQALDVLKKAAGWFVEWAARFTRDEMDDILDYETGGMLEAFADLYGLTGAPEHRALVERYDRRRLFDPVARNDDVLSLKHANTMIPEVYGAARAAEVLAAHGADDQRFRTIALKFWDAVVPSRMYATGGHTHGEMWSKPNELAGTLVEQNQELCTAYNMMWLSKYLFRWTGEAKYADYYERNLINAILSAQHPETGMITYYHAFKTGGVKKWGSRTNDFWCCYGTGVQAHAEYPNAIYFHAGDTLVVNLLTASRVEWAGLTLTQQTAYPENGKATIIVEKAAKGSRTILVRVPWWAPTGRGMAKAAISVNETPQMGLKPSSYCKIARRWKAGDRIEINYPMTLWACPMPDDKNLVAAMYGPMVLAGLVSEDTPIKGDPAKPSTWLEQLDGLRFRTKGQKTDLDFIPMWQVLDQKLGIYFKVKA
ncbi:MAG: glycoside hydrolase family 127 protein [Verrucomicrobia bacterium]|nr:glycoside hydrolase family 127 protein [Verrucomicrobiota bacterium]